jgi:hypothetical protein
VPGKSAVPEAEKLLDQARQAAGSFVAAGRRLVGPPEPEPPRRRLPVLLIAVGVLALVRSMHRAQQAQARTST